MTANDFAPFLARAMQFMERVESALRQDIEQPDWNSSIAFLYRKRVSGQGYLVPVRQVGAMRLDDLLEIDIQKEKIARNTAQFVSGQTANNVLLPVLACKVPAEQLTQAAQKFYSTKHVPASLLLRSTLLD